MIYLEEYIFLNTCEARHFIVVHDDHVLEKNAVFTTTRAWLTYLSLGYYQDHIRQYHIQNLLRSPGRMYHSYPRPAGCHTVQNTYSKY